MTKFYKVLKYLYEEGVFKDTKYNKFNGENDYDFLVKMFNKNKRGKITEMQQKKINAIIINSIMPYLNQKLGEKIR